MLETWSRCGWVVATIVVLGSAAASAAYIVDNWPPTFGPRDTSEKEEIRCEVDGRLVTDRVFRNEFVEVKHGQTITEPGTLSTGRAMGKSSIRSREDWGVGFPLPSEAEYIELVTLHGRPSAVRVDNGPEFTAQSFVDWCAEHGVATHYIQPGKPDQNAYIERFNRSYRTEVLDAHLFESIAELRALTDARHRVDNGERPHLGG